MKRLLKHPGTNAACLSIFSLFYALVFILRLDKAVLAIALLLVTALVVVLLLARRKPFDEYHTALLLSCLAVALVLTLIAIAIFFLIVLYDPTQVIEKFTGFITIHWATVVLADLVFILLCRWR